MRKTAALIVSAIWGIGVTHANPVLAQSTPTPTPSLAPSPTPSPTVSSPTPTPTPSPGPGAFLSTSSLRGYILLLILILIVVLVWFIPFMTDLIWSHRSQLAAVKGQAESTTAQTAVPGNPASFSRRHLVRALIAFTIVTIIGIALLLVLSGNTLDSEDLRKTLVAAVVAIVGTVIGFYFGGRTAGEAAAAATAIHPTGAVTLTPATANFTESKTENVFTLSNNSSAPVTVLSAAVTDSSTGFSVDTNGVPAGSWTGKATVVAPSGQLPVGVTWDPPSAGDGPFISTLAIAHTGTGAPSAQLMGTKNPPAGGAAPPAGGAAPPAGGAAPPAGGAAPPAGGAAPPAGGA
jgi:hypothetical protein